MDIYYIGYLRTRVKKVTLHLVLVKQKNVFEEVDTAIRKVGPSGVQLAAGIKKIAEAGGMTTKLMDCGRFLQGLGFLKIDAIEAAANYTNALGSMADKMDEVVSSGGNLNDIWDKSTNTLNTQGELGAKLVPVLKEVSQAYPTAATSGEDVRLALLKG